MKLHLRLTLDVEYDTDSRDVESYLRDRLSDLPRRAAGEGLFSGNCDAEVESWSADVTVVKDVLAVPPALSEDEIAAFMLRRIEDGALAFEDIPTRLARYGLMDPTAFSDEMRERIENARTEA